MTTMTQHPHSQRGGGRPAPTPPPTPPADESRVSVPFMATRAFSFYEVRFRLDAKQGRALRVVHDALLQRGVKLDDGHIVDGPHDTMRWLLEQVAKGIPANVLRGEG